MYTMKFSLKKNDTGNVMRDLIRKNGHGHDYNPENDKQNFFPRRRRYQFGVALCNKMVQPFIVIPLKCC